MLAAFDAWRATADAAYAAAVKTAWNTPVTPTRRKTPARRPRPGTGAHSPAAETAEERAARKEASRLFWSEEITHVVERTKLRRGITLEQSLPGYRHEWERSGCRSCERGFVDLDEDGTRVAPCLVCRPARDVAVP